VAVLPLAEGKSRFFGGAARGLRTRLLRPRAGLGGAFYGSWDYFQNQRVGTPAAGKDLARCEYCGYIHKTFEGHRQICASVLGLGPKAKHCEKESRAAYLRRCLRKMHCRIGWTQLGHTRAALTIR
jgi:hypothetical protein